MTARMVEYANVCADHLNGSISCGRFYAFLDAMEQWTEGELDEWLAFCVAKRTAAEKAKGIQRANHAT